MSVFEAGRPDQPARPGMLGLTAAEARARLARGEGNATVFSTSRSYTRIFLENAFTPVHSVLFFVAILLVVLGLPADALMTGGLVLINVVVGVVQEGRAKRRLDRIALLNRPQATVVRGGVEVEVDPAAIVRGDLVVARPGDQIQADGEVIAEAGLGVDESLLSGESEVVRKGPGDAVYSGTFCASGSGYYHARRVGRESTAQQITARARAFRVVRTPLQREVSLIIWGMAVVVTLLSLRVLYSFHEIYGHIPVVETVRAAAVIVALVPQGLAFMITVTYTVAALRMAGAGSLIQRLNAVESLSHVDVLCLDKTGTLTSNVLRLEQVQALDRDEATLRRWLADFAASASFSNRTNDAIRAALPGRRRAAVAETPFDSARKWSAITLEEPDMTGIYVLGAPEVLREHLVPAAELGPRVDEWTGAGLRVLLFAYSPEVRPPEVEAGAGASLPARLEPLGLLCLRDELRPEAAATVRAFREAGIALRLVSGDHPQTVSSLAMQAGITPAPAVLTGDDVDRLDDGELEEVATRTDVFARIAPQHKERIVRALQARGRYVAMVGDGVNDVLALKSAQVAVAMRSGAQVARGVADLVLLDDSFAALPRAFLEGQRIRRAMEASLKLFLSRTFAVTLVILGAALLSSEFPLTPRHTGMMALLTVGIPVLGLAVWAKPGASARSLLRSVLPFVVPAAVTIAAAMLFVYELYASSSVTAGRTALTLTATLCGIALVPYASLPPQRWFRPRALLDDPRASGLALAMLSLFFLSVTWGPLRRLYELSALTWDQYAAVAVTVAVWSVVLALLWRAWPGGGDRGVTPEASRGRGAAALPGESQSPLPPR